MSVTMNTRPAPAAPAEVDAPPARNITRIFGGVAMLASAPLFLAASLTSPPQKSNSDADYLASLSADTGRTVLSADLYHYAWITALFGAIGVLGLVVRGRGRTMTVVGALLAVLGAAQLSGLLLSDFFNVATGRHLTASQALAVFQDVQNDGSVGVWYMTAFATFVGTPLMLAGLARARRATWWLVPMSVAGAIIPFFVTGTAGTVLSAIGLVPGVVVGVLLLRRDRAGCDC